MSIVRAFADAFNRGDVDGLLDCFTEDATYTDDFYGPHRGKVVLREMFERMFKEGRDYRWQMDTVVETPQRVAAEWRFGYVVTDAVPRSAGKRIQFRGLSLFELAGGRIIAYREQFDLGIALLQLGFAPESIAKVLSLRLQSSM